MDLLLCKNKRCAVVLLFLLASSLLFIFSIDHYVKSSGEFGAEFGATEQSVGNSFDNFINKSCINPSLGKKEKTSIALLKVHKTGSTTLASILYRYGVHRGLSFVMPQKPKLHQFFPQTIDQARQLFYPPCKEKYDILNIHSRYNGREVLTKYMHRDTFVIATLRHPAEQMISWFRYYGYSKQLEMVKVSFSDYLDNPKQYSRNFSGGNPMDLMWNGMSNDIGLSEFNIPKGLTMSQLKNDPEHMKSVERFLEWAESEIDFFLISEVFDESLILLKDMLNWKLEDLMYFSQNAAANKINDVDDDLRDKLIQFSYIDYLLYQKMLSKFLTLKSEKEKYIEEEVFELQKLNKEFSDYCLEEIKINPKLYGSVPILGNKLRIERENNKCCYDAAMDEASYVMLLKQYMAQSCAVTARETSPGS